MNPPKSKKRLLIVDDEPGNITLLVRYLSAEYDISVATNGMDALDIVAVRQPDLILLDVLMPGMTGHQVCRTLKSHEETRNIPVIFITAMTGESDEMKGFELGAVDFISKPFVPGVVEARVRTHLELRTAHKELANANEALLYERSVVEDVLANMRQSALFDKKNLSFLVSPVERTAGDMVFSAFRPDGTQHIMLGDFTGHGLTAAIGGPLVSDIFYSETARGQTMDLIFSEINIRLHQILRHDMFLAGGFLEVNANREAVTIWNSGIPEVLIFRDGRLIQQIASSHLPRGLTNRPDKAGVVVSLHKNDRAFVYSDGVVETRDRQGHMFGHDRLLTFLQSAWNQGDTPGLLNQVLEAFRGGGDQEDDVTFLELIC